MRTLDLHIFIPSIQEETKAQFILINMHSSKSTAQWRHFLACYLARDPGPPNIMCSPWWAANLAMIPSLKPCSGPHFKIFIRYVWVKWTSALCLYKKMGREKTDEARVGKCWWVVKLGEYMGVHYIAYFCVSEITQHSIQTGPSKIWPLTHILCFGYPQYFLVFLCALNVPAYTSHSWGG